MKCLFVAVVVVVVVCFTYGKKTGKTFFLNVIIPVLSFQQFLLPTEIFFVKGGGVKHDSCHCTRYCHIKQYEWVRERERKGKR